ncbi:MAG TPA: hypothetical protein DC054_10725 [Blastocatellia bacterium]|nr:hypothetical protein [Blastocatellia bacterium]
MNDPTTNKTTPPTSSAKGECCTDLKCESGIRNNYFDGKRLTTDSFRVEQTYSLERRHLLNRAIHGWGVVYGYEVTSADSQAQQDGSGQLKIGAGLALDTCGRELLETGATIQFKNVIFLDREGKRWDLDEAFKQVGISTGFSWDNPPPALVEGVKKWCWLLSVHYAERDIDHVRIEDHCQCGRDEWDHLCETVHYSLRPIDCDKCCGNFGCELECECGTGHCCDDAGEYTHEKGLVPPTRETRQRGGCQCLCKHLTHLKVGGECGLCEIEEPCGKVRVDVRNGVPLACVKLVTDKCGLAFGTVEDACGPRRLVKRNDLLFDLIRGCDLTRIKDIGWAQWHRKSDPIPFEDFANAFAQGGDQEPEYVTRDFWVQFSRPVRRDTVRRDCFVMTIITSEPDDVWWETLRVPIVRVKAEDTDLVDHATIVVDGPWLRDTLRGAASIFQGKVTRVEVEVRGDFIVDCNGQTVDANPRGRVPVPTGNGTPGGTFLSTFLVGPAPTPSRPASYYSEDRIKGVS